MDVAAGPPSVTNTRGLLSGKRRKVRSNAGRRGGFRRLRVRQQPETKNNDTDILGDSIDGTFKPYSLVLMAQNVSDIGRLGRVVRATSLQWKGTIALAPIFSSSAPTMSAITAPIPDFFVNIVIVQDLQCNGAVCTYEDIFEPITVGSYNVGFNVRNPSNASRFKVLSRQQIHVKPDIQYTCESPYLASGNYVNVWQTNAPPSFDNAYTITPATIVAPKYYFVAKGFVCPFQGYLNLDLPIYYRGGASTLAAVKSNNIFVFCTRSINSDGATVENRTKFDFTARLSFVDV